MIDFLLHSDRHLLQFVSTYGLWVYGLLFAIVFAETGFVVTPFLPGDSLLFAAGALCATGALSHRLLNRDHLARGHAFFEQYGGKAVVLSRFVPIVRTFLPFVAGASAMKPSAFGFYNLVGAAGWVALCLGAGFLFGNVPIVRQNFSLVTIGIVIVSVLPMVVEYLRHHP